MRNMPQTWLKYNCDRLRLQQVLAQVPDADRFWLLDDATEALIRKAPATAEQATLRVEDEFSGDYPAIVFGMKLGKGLLRPWSPTGMAASGGWVVRYQHRDAGGLALARTDGGILGRVAIFPEISLAAKAAWLHAGQKPSSAPLGTGLYWSAGAPMPEATL